MDSGDRHPNAFLSALAPATWVEVAPHLVTHRLKSGQVLYRPGDPLHCAYFPITAVLSSMTVLKDGAAIEACMTGRESAYGLFRAIGDTAAAEFVVAQIAGDALSMSTAQLWTLAGDNEPLRRLIARHLQLNAVKAQRSVACVAFHRIEARLATWLLLRSDSAPEEAIDITQDILACCLGVQRTTVTSAARALQNAKLIQYRRGKLRILRRSALETRACDCWQAASVPLALERQAEI